MMRLSVLRRRVLILSALSVTFIIYASLEDSWQQKHRLAAPLSIEFIVKSNFSPTKNVAGIEFIVKSNFSPTKNVAGIEFIVKSNFSPTKNVAGIIIAPKLVHHRDIYKPRKTRSKKRISWKLSPRQLLAPPPFTLNSTIPKILLWTWTRNHRSYCDSFRVDSTTLDGCPTKCEFSYDQQQLNLSDAVVFHIPSTPRGVRVQHLPSFHHPEQIWVFQSRESPSWPYTPTAELNRFKNIFNWTMTYRTDSEVYHQTRILRKLTASTSATESSGLTDARIHSIIKKPKLAAWIVSHCVSPSNREKLVRQLQKFIPVDIYGSCGRLSCRDKPKTHSKSDCYQHVATKYKFYLSFENSLCSDYVTEKFFEALRHDMIPVVYGRANYTAIAPPNSFIDTASFGNVEELAKYMQYLDAHDEEYLKYFDWKQNYEDINMVSKGYCQLCKKLMFDVGEDRRHIYEDIGRWWKNAPKRSSDSEYTEKLACLRRPKSFD